MKHAAFVTVLISLVTASCGGTSPSAPSNSTTAPSSMATAMTEAWPSPGIGATDLAVCLRASQGPACFSAVRSTPIRSAAVNTPGAPSNLNALVTGNSVTLVWSAPTSGDPVLTYILEAGSASGAVNLANIATNSTGTTFFASGVGAGTYFVRVRAQNAGGASGPSNEVVVVVGSIGCTSMPGAAGGLSGSVNSGTVSLVWTAPAGGCAPTSYILQAGSAQGLSNLANFNTGNSATTYVASGVGPGAYFVRVRAVNGNGTSGPSNEVVVTVQSSGGTSGRIGNLSTAADIITYNQSVNVGFSIPVEGLIERQQGIITRWELPIPVYVAASITGTCVTDALSYWQSVTGLSFVLVAGDAEPRITVRAAGADELNIAEGSGLVYRTYPNNQARLGVVKILTTSANCVAPSYLFRHELGHAIGIFGHIPGGGLMDPSRGSITASQREIDFLTQLYRLPHGTRIEADGTWRVVQ
jgi:fibronectin type III domain protein